MIAFLVNLIVGGVAGWLAGKLMNSEGSVLRNVILGLFGGVVGDLVLGLVGISGSWMIGGMFVSVIGACILIWLGRKLSGR